MWHIQVHEMMDITEKVPRVGGRELDLHMLYRNVTQLGGCERVIQTKHWRDAAESFNFPETITSVSFSLRKAYVTFLWDYEQVKLSSAVRSRGCRCCTLRFCAAVMTSILLLTQRAHLTILRYV